MAVVKAGGSYGIDFSRVDLSGLLYGTVTYESPTQLTVSYSGEQDNFFGTGFAYDSTGFPVGGTITAFNQILYGNVVYTLSSISVAVPTFVDWVYHGQTADALTSILGGSDSVYGSGNFDLLEGFGGDDHIYGMGGADTLYGGDGDDTIRPGVGHASIDGGDGVDTASFSGFAHDYALTLNGGGGFIAGGPEGADDVLSSVENVEFLDGTLTFDTGSTAAQILRLYDSFLGRAPDAAGFESYLRFVQAGHSFQDMAANAAASPEFHDATAGLTDTQYVTYVYEHSLHREPDPAGLQNYLDALHSGALTRTSMIVQAAESPEHVALTAGVVGQGLWIPDEKVESLELLYDAAVQRQPDATGIAGYGALVAAGTSYKAIANQMSQSAEFLSHHASQSDADYVDSLYVAEVGRHADPAGLAAYVDQLAHGFTRGDVLYETAFSQEHQSHVLAFYDPLLA